MIYTLTLNPAVDYYLSFDSFQEGHLNTPKETYKLPGGKGINVSRVLKNFNIDSTCLGFIGGFTGHFINSILKESGINTNFLEANGDTRINIKLNNNGLESEIAGTSPDISKTNIESLYLFLKTKLKSDDILVLSGSVPSSISEEIYGDIIDLIPSGVKVILDTRGEPLKKSLHKGVFLIKPNLTEINEFFGSNYSTTEELIQGGKKLQQLGAVNVLISLGSKGSIFITENDIYISDVPKGELVSSNGAGDSMIGGFIYGIYHNLSLENSYKIGIAAGSATAFSKGLTTLERMKNLLKSVKINKI